MKRNRVTRGTNRARDPAVLVTLDSGSHINVHAQRPERAARAVQTGYIGNRLDREHG
jgi:hypothetical protein